jgi:UDP-N-acetylglucosamine 4,6-dehydratase/5-epimerase
MKNLNGKVVFVTGGTGSFGQAFVSKLLDDSSAKKIIVYSRDELKQFEMREKFKNDRIEFVLGDVRDLPRLTESTTGVDVVIHAAAMKQIGAAELNPMEAIKTNILGAENIVKASLENRVSKVVALSTDKAANPANLYGATKLCSDKLMIAGNRLSKDKATKFSVVRYGNVLGSRGSVIPLFREQLKKGTVTVTDEKMTRFWLTLNDGVKLVLDSLDLMVGGEIFVPKIPSFKVIDVAKVVAPQAEIVFTGIRPGEKMHEIMITEDDAYYTREFETYYVILSPDLVGHSSYLKNGNPVVEDFKFSSDHNKNWHTKESFKSLLETNGII